MSEANWVTVFAGILTISGPLIGFAVANWFEERREKSRRVEDRKLRNIAEQRKAIADLQDALGRLGNASSTAVTLHPFYLAKPLEERTKVIYEPWHQEWTNAGREISILIPRIEDPDIKERAKAVEAIAGDRTYFVEKLGDREALQERRNTLETAINELNEVAGRVYLSLDPAALATKI